MEDLKKYENSDLVTVKNFYDYEIVIHSVEARKNFVIPPLAEAILPVGVLKEAVLRRLFWVTGLNNKGDHAPLKICDPDVYRFLFGCDDKSRHICREFFLEVLKIEDKKVFEKTVIFDLIRTRTEARFCMQYVKEIENLDELKENILAARCDYFLKDKGE